MEKDWSILNLAESARGQTHPIITAKSRSNLFSYKSLRSMYSSISSSAVYRGTSLSRISRFEAAAFRSWCLSADIVAKYAQRFVSFWTCSFVPPVTIWPDFAFKDTWVSSLNKSREHWVLSSTLNSAGTFMREWKDFQSDSIFGSLEIISAVDSRTFKISATPGRLSGFTWKIYFCLNMLHTNIIWIYIFRYLYFKKINYYIYYLLYNLHHKRKKIKEIK